MCVSESWVDHKYLDRQPGVFENAAFSNRCGGSFILSAFPVDASPIVAISKVAVLCPRHWVGTVLTVH